MSNCGIFSIVGGSFFNREAMHYYCSLPGFELHIRAKNSRWILLINGEAYGIYASPADAAKAAADHGTGDCGFDSAAVAAPDDIGAWRPY